MRTALLPLLLLAACDPVAQDTAPPSDPSARGDCNPLVPTHCLLPFPSSFFLEEDPTTGTGYRVAFGPGSLPLSDEDVRTDPTYWHEKDGFPTLGSLYVDFPGVSLDGVVSHEDLAAHLDADVKTVILDAETGARVPHFLEVDGWGEDTDRHVLMLRPVQPLEHARRYVAGIRGLVDGAGAPVEVPEAFVALRDGAESADRDVERQRDHYDAVVFPALEAAGFARGELQMAFDFVTVSAENSLSKALFIRDDALARTPAGGPPYTIGSVTDADCGSTNIGRTIKGTFTAPLYLTSWDPGSVFTRGDDGMPYFNGTAEIPFTIRVPCTLLQDPRPGLLMQYGHGLLGDQSEIYAGYLGEMANRYGWVQFGVDWTGMKGDDVPALLESLGNGLSDFATIPERSQQGFVEQLLAGRMMLGDMANDENLVVDGVSLVDTSALYYYGNSQGSILGGAYVALSPDIRRGVFGVGGTPYSLLLTRSHHFDLYFILLDSVYSDPMDISMLIALMQMLWDPGETAGWAWYMNQRDLGDGTPSKQVLMQVGIGDAQVPTLGAHVAARAWGASLVDPPVRDVWGLETRTAPFEGSALVEFDYGAEEPVECVPPDDETDTHELPRREEVGQEQIRAFLEEGVVTHTCDGACDPD